MANKPKAEIATIDCVLVTVETDDGTILGMQTANKVAVEPQLDEEEAVKLVIKGKLIAQKPPVVTITGNKVTLTDNVFIPELVLILQGGTILYDGSDPNKVIGYTPPVAGSADKGEVFKLGLYSAHYSAAGTIIQYEKILYPNCQGTPVAFGAEDGVFRVSEYVVNSAPVTGEAPYAITYIPELPALT